jgi:transcriptional regulator with XRE-family HTH domain
VSETILGLFGDRVRTAREAAQIRQLDLATAVGLSRSSIANIEGGRQELSLPMAVQIAAVLDTTLAELLGGRRERSEPWLTLVTRITESERTYARLAEDCWRSHDYLTAVRYRGMAEGLDIARNHQASVVAEAREVAAQAAGKAE